MAQTMTIGEGKQRLNTHISSEAYNILLDYTAPRSIGTFLSSLLVEYHQNRSLIERIRFAEKEIADVKAQVVLQEMKDRLHRAVADPEGETVPFEQVMKEMGIDVDYQPHQQSGA